MLRCFSLLYLLFISRPGYVVNVPVARNMFLLLPTELQRGHMIKVVPVLFSVGINELASMAEK